VAVLVGIIFSDLYLTPELNNPLIVWPWGRIVSIRADLDAGAKSEAEGGTGIAEKFWEWSEEQIKPYV
jgi:retinol dehydrogenase 12